MSEELQRAEEALARARVAVRRAREYLPQAFTAHGKRRAIRLLAAREARLLGLVAQVLTLRAAVRDGKSATRPIASAEAVAYRRATPPSAPAAPHVVWVPPRLHHTQNADRRMRAKLDERVRDLVARSQHVVAQGLAARAS